MTILAPRAAPKANRDHPCEYINLQQSLKTRRCIRFSARPNVFHFESFLYFKDISSPYRPVEMAPQSLARLSPADLAKLPAVQPPLGVKIDFDAPNPLAPAIYTVTSIFMALSFFFVGIRAYTKVVILRKACWDDRKPQSPLVCSHRRC